MTQRRLNDLTIIIVEEKSENISVYYEIIDSFASEKARKVPL